MKVLFISSAFLGTIFSLGFAATPRIQKVEGNFAPDSALTVVGSHFGVKPNPNPWIWDPLDNGEINPLWESAYDLKLTKTRQRHKGSKYSATLNFSSEALEGRFRAPILESRRWFVQYWFQLARNWTWGTTDETGKNRFLSKVIMLRLWNPQMPEEYFQVSALGWNDKLEIGSQDSAPFFEKESLNALLTKNEWHLLQLEVEENSYPGVPDGRYRLWLDGGLLSDREGIPTRITRDAYRWPTIVGFSSAWDPNIAKGEKPRGLRTFFMDDVYLDTTWARVEVGDRPTYSQCQHREIQIPTEWNEGQLRFDASVGAFSEGKPVFLFVINEKGEISHPGWPLWVGGGQVLDKKEGGKFRPPQKSFSLSSRKKMSFGMEVFSVEIFDLSGAIVRSIWRESKNEPVAWDGKTSEGKPAPVGEVRLKIQDFWGNVEIIPFEVVQ